jgi:hypothetical protein
MTAPSAVRKQFFWQTTAAGLKTPFRRPTIIRDRAPFYINIHVIAQVYPAAAAGHLRVVDEVGQFLSDLQLGGFVGARVCGPGGGFAGACGF